MRTVFYAILTIPRQESAAADKLYAKATQSRSIKALKHYRDIKQHKKYKIKKAEDWHLKRLLRNGLYAFTLNCEVRNQMRKDPITR